jgi:hypothetical protein
MTNASDFMDQIIKSTMSQLWPAFKPFVLALWPYILLFGILIVGGVILQIIMIRVSGNRNRLSSDFNSMVGSVTRLCLFGFLIFVCYKIFGTKVIDDTWFEILGAAAISLTGFLLWLVGFWPYRKKY